MCLVWSRNLDFKQVSWVILIKVVVEAMETHSLVELCQTY